MSAKLSGLGVGIPRKGNGRTLLLTVSFLARPMSTVAVAAPPGTLTNTLATISTSTVVLGKRKSRPASTSLSIRLEVSSGCEQPTDSECETDISYSHATTSAGPSTLTKRLRRYKCQHAGCSKAYTKPSRLAEHERSHTGDVRDFVVFFTFHVLIVLIATLHL